MAACQYYLNVSLCSPVCIHLWSLVYLDYNFFEAGAIFLFCVCTVHSTVRSWSMHGALKAIRKNNNKGNGIKGEAISWGYASSARSQYSGKIRSAIWMLGYDESISEAATALDYKIQIWVWNFPNVWKCSFAGVLFGSNSCHFIFILQKHLGALVIEKCLSVWGASSHQRTKSPLLLPKGEGEGGADLALVLPQGVERWYACFLIRLFSDVFIADQVLFKVWF